MEANFSCRVTPLKLARIAANLNQRALGAVAGRSASYICRLERRRGYARLNPNVAQAIADAVGVPPQILFGERWAG